MGMHAHPEVTLHTISLAEYMKPIDAGAGWEPVRPTPQCPQNRWPDALTNPHEGQRSPPSEEPHAPQNR